MGGEGKLSTQNLDVKTCLAGHFVRASPPHNCKQLLYVKIE